MNCYAIRYFLFSIIHSPGIRSYIMIWVILFIPLGLYISLSIISDANIPTLGAILLTVVIFFIVELRQLRRDHTRNKAILWVMLLMLIFLSLNMVIALI